MPVAASDLSRLFAVMNSMSSVVTSFTRIAEKRSPALAWTK